MKVILPQNMEMTRVDDALPKADGKDANTITIGGFELDWQK